MIRTAMDFAYVMVLDADPDQVFALVLDEDYLVGRCRATGSVPLDVSTQGSPQTGAVVRLRRSVPMLLPSFAARFAADRVVVQHVETWSPPDPHGTRTATFSGHVEGAPGSLTGRLRIAREGAATSYALSGAIDIPVPLVGGRLARYAAEQLRLGLQAEEEFTRRWLAEHTRDG
jgi:hypothetical protein